MHVCIGLGCEQSAHAAAAVQSHGHRPLAAAPPRRSHAPCTSTIAPCRARRDKRRVSHGRLTVTGYAWRILGVFSQSRGILFAVHPIDAKEVKLFSIRRWSCSFYLGRFAHALLANGQALLIDLRSLMDDGKRSMCGRLDQPQDALLYDRRRNPLGTAESLCGSTAQQLCFAK